MDSNRTVLIATAMIVFLVGVFYLATLRPLVSTDGTFFPLQEAETSPAGAEDGAANTESLQPQSQAAVEASEPTQESTAEPSVDESKENEPADEASETPPPEPDAPEPDALEPDAPEPDVMIYSYQVVNSYPHDPEAFTQGLIWHDRQLYEGTGLRGRSSLRKVTLEDGSVTQQIALPDNLFGEGITIFGNRIYQLTWQANVGFVYDLESFEELRSFSYPTEGWGITHDGEQLIMSDGSTRLYFWDPETLEEIRRIEVTLRNEPVPRLNELEYIDGIVYANIWQTNWIAMIDPETGIVRGMINMEGLLQIPAGHTGPVDVLNGIAYDDVNDRLFVTGKLWPQLYEIKLVP